MKMQKEKEVWRSVEKEQRKKTLKIVNLIYFKGL